MKMMGVMTDIVVLAQAGGEPSPWVNVVPVLVGVMSLILLIVAARALWRKRLIQNIPTSKVKGITIGLNELKGEAISRVPMRSYLTNTDCVFYSYKIEEEYEKTERYKDQDGEWKTRKKKEWKTVKSGEQRPRFTLRDDTGSVRVDPDHGEVQAERVLTKTVKRRDPLWRKGPWNALPASTGKRRLTEEVIANGQTVYLLGTARIREDIVAPEIAHEPTAEIFLISTKEKKKVVSGYAWTARLTFFFSLLLAIGTPPLAYKVNQIELGEVSNQVIMWMIAAGAVVLLIYSALYMKTIYNGLVDVRNRAKRAWSMLEVELKRRHDLIPNLVNMVRAVAGHELETLAATVQARAGASVPGEPGEEAVRQVDAMLVEQNQTYQEVFAVVESYPTIKSDRGFERLMRELTLTEDKIALARTFYNDSVERLNTRVESFPDSLFSSVANTTPRLMLGAEEFEKKPIQVKLVEDQEPLPEEEEEASPEDAGEESGPEELE